MAISKMNARNLIVDLLMASAGYLISIKQMVLAGRIFGISENGIRVAVARLASEGVIESVERGVYQFSEQSREWANIMLNRNGGIKATKAWNQQYFVVFTGMLGRVDRTALKRRERALRRYGFKELEQGLFIRPDNLAETFENILADLKAKGLEEQAMMCRIQHFDQRTTEKIWVLWPSALLNEKYENFSRTIQEWLATRHELKLEDAARESLLLGRQIIFQLMNDPLLPEPFVDVTLRNQFAKDVLQLDQVGQQIWREFFENRLGSSANTLQHKSYAIYSRLF